MLILKEKKRIKEAVNTPTFKSAEDIYTYVKDAKKLIAIEINCKEFKSIIDGTQCKLYNQNNELLIVFGAQGLHIRFKHIDLQRSRLSINSGGLRSLHLIMKPSGIQIDIYLTV